MDSSGSAPSPSPPGSPAAEHADAAAPPPARNAFAVMLAAAAKPQSAGVTRTARAAVVRPRSPSDGDDGRGRVRRKYHRHKPSEASTAPFPAAGPVSVPVEQCLPAQRGSLEKLVDAGALPEWVVVCSGGLACSYCIAAVSAVTHGPVKPAHPWIKHPCTSKDVLQAIHNHEHGQKVTRAELRARKLKDGTAIPTTRHKLSAAHLKTTKSLVDAVTSMHTREEAAIKKRLKAVYWLAKENCALAKYAPPLPPHTHTGATHSRCRARQFAGSLP